jgi:surface polysaccharide O-acyltransferase-like enzyme
MTNSPVAPARIHSKNKIVYIDHLKVGLTMLVVVHHAVITYGGPGGWYYTQKTVLLSALLPMTMFVAVNQAFFMGCFFFLSALFIPSSYDKKGPAKFVTDRLLRLGIPLIIYSLLLSPFLSYLVYNFADGHPVTYWQYLGGFDSWIDFGVLWFVAALLLFTLVYVLYRLALPNKPKSCPLPSVSTIILFAIALGIVSYWVRIMFPVGWIWKPLGFQLGHFPQYIALFILGLVASESKWIILTDYRMGKKMAIIAFCLVFIGFPLFFVGQHLLNFPIKHFNVGGHWPSLWYAVWEQLTGMSIITALLCIGKERWNRTTSFLNQLAQSSFAVYIFHPLVLISLSVALSQWPLEPAWKVLLVAPLAITGSFIVGWTIVQIPGVRKII